MIIAVDFDGTIVEHKYPAIGKLVPGAIPCLKALQDRGDKLILYTMRSGDQLWVAVDFLEKRGLAFYGVNENPTQKNWTSSPKIYAQMYIDDAALGCPAVALGDERAYVDWYAVAKLLGISLDKP